jgi:predicted nicotinamide N-methyase
VTLRAFIEQHAAVGSAPLVPEVRLWLASEVTPLWHATEAWLAARDVPPPFWAFAWAGGQALARYVLDHPSCVAGKRVMDFACGSGLVGIAAAKAGAASVVGVDVDPFAGAAARMNAELNDVASTFAEVIVGDIVGQPLAGIDVVLVGDICYEAATARRVLPWLRALGRDGHVVRMADPGRAYAPSSAEDGAREVARIVVATPRELEGTDDKDCVVWALS